VVIIYLQLYYSTVPLKSSYFLLKGYDFIDFHFLVGTELRYNLEQDAYMAGKYCSFIKCSKGRKYDTLNVPRSKERRNLEMHYNGS
jgi:hypothetical protein